MYTILVTDNNELITTVSEKIMQRSNLVNSIQFLVNQTYNDLITMDCDVILECRLPVSNKYIPVRLKPSDELYKNRVQYVLPLDITYTAEFGDLELTLSFVYLELQDDGTFKEMVRKVGTTIVPIHECTRWDDYIPSSDLSNLVQMVLLNRSLTEQNRVDAEMIAFNSACNIKMDNEKQVFYLVGQNGQMVGNPVPYEAFGHELVEAMESGSTKVIL